jgi:hypothetical protein
VPLNRKYRKLDPEQLVKYVEDMGECSFEASSEFFDGIEVWENREAKKSKNSQRPRWPSVSWDV